MPGGPPSATLTCTILEFLGISLTPIMHEITDEASDPCFIRALIFCAVVADSTVRQQAVSVAKKLLSHFAQVRPWLEETDSDTVEKLPACIWRHRYESLSQIYMQLARALTLSSSKVIVGLCQRILDEESHSLLTELHGYLRDCLFLMKKLPVSQLLILQAWSRNVLKLTNLFCRVFVPSRKMHMKFQRQVPS